MTSTKQTVISIIENIDFEKFSIARSVAIDDESDFIPFVSALLDDFRSLQSKRLLKEGGSELFDPPSPSPTPTFPSQVSDEVAGQVDDLEVAGVTLINGNTGNHLCL